MISSCWSTLKAIGRSRQMMLVHWQHSLLAARPSRSRSVASHSREDRRQAIRTLVVSLVAASLVVENPVVADLAVEYLVVADHFQRGH